MGEQEKIPVWLDCDPGHDDAFAMLMCTHHPRLNLLGISTVHGNSSLEHTTLNAARLLTAFSSTHIPIYSGASHGLIRPAVHADSIHGISGLDGTALLPKATISPSTESAVEAMSHALIKTKKGTAWLVATGALTNIAILFERYPEVVGHIKGLSIMGGAIGENFTNAPLGKVDGLSRIGNWSVWAEFNILVDPEAAAAIFSSPALRVKTTLIPLDVTHLVLADKKIQKLLLTGKSGKEEGKLREMLVELLMFFAKTYNDVFGIAEGPPLHDPLAVAAILGAEVPFYDFSKEGRMERFEVVIVTEGTHEDAANGAQTGRTVVRLLPDGEEGVRIPRGLDVPRFWEVLEECLKRANVLANQNKVFDE